LGAWREQRLAPRLPREAGDDPLPPDVISVLKRRHADYATTILRDDLAIGGRAGAPAVPLTPLP